MRILKWIGIGVLLIPGLLWGGIKSNLATTKPYTFEQGAILHPNDWVYWQYYNGRSGIDPNGNSGGLFRNISHVYEDGLLFGYMEGSTLYMVGNQYFNTWSPLEERIYRIRKDWRRLSQSEIIHELGTMGISPITDADIQRFLDFLAYNWENWPWQEGAPWVDVNGNGVYDPDEDIAGYPFADDMVFYRITDQDSSLVEKYFCGYPLGLQLDVLVWGVNAASSVLNQALFKTVRFRNIRGRPLDSLHFSVWVDADVGSYSDDVVGCDSVLGLAYTYNGRNSDPEFEKYGLNPGAVGYDVVLGPWIASPGDTAWIRGEQVANYKNLSMTSFNTIFRFPEGRVTRLTQCDPFRTGVVFNLIRGYRPTGDIFNPLPQYHRDTGAPTRFPFNGDPVTGSGDLDGIVNQPGDRQFYLNIGPFPLQVDEQQEVHIAIMAGLPGESRVDAVANLKATDRVIQKIADHYFQFIPQPPQMPEVTATTYPDKIILDWGENPDVVRQIEETISYESENTGYRFEGYVVYQYTSALKEADRIPIAVFDVKNGVTKVYGWRFLPEIGEKVWMAVIEGTDRGVQHTFVVEKDYIQNTPLVVGKSYYFGVSAYSYNPNPQIMGDEVLESPVARITVVPQAPPPGTQYSSQFGDELPIEHIAGNSMGLVRAMVANPGAIKGHEYEIYFTIEEDSSSPNFGQVVWNLQRVDDGEELITGHSISTNPQSAIPVLADGLELWVANPEQKFRDFQVVANAHGPLAEPIGAAAPWMGFPASYPSYLQQVFGGRWLIHQENPEVDYYTDFEALVTRYLPVEKIPESYEIRFTYQGEAHFPWTSGGIHSIPFEVWNIGNEENPDDDYRCFVFVRDLEDSLNWGEFNITNIDHSVSSRPDDPMTDSYYIVEPWNTQPGEGGYQTLQGIITAQSDSEVVATAYWEHELPGISRPGLAGLTFVNWNGGDVPDTEKDWNEYPYNALLPESGTIFRILSNVPFTVSDRYRITASPVIRSVDIERKVVENVTVYPNPFIVDNPLDPNNGQFVYFYHLPRKAVVRIFALDGTLVRRLEKEDDSQFLRWDLRNDAGRRVASGIYIAHLQMQLSDGSQVQKTLKIAILQGRERF